MAGIAHPRPHDYEPVVIVPRRRIPRLTDAEREIVTRLRLMLTQARDRLECHRDPMVGEIDRALDDMTKQPARMTTPQFVERMTQTEAIISRIERERAG